MVHRERPEDEDNQPVLTTLGRILPILQWHFAILGPAIIGRLTSVWRLTFETLKLSCWQCPLWNFTILYALRKIYPVRSNKLQKLWHIVLARFWTTQANLRDTTVLIGEALIDVQALFTSYVYILLAYFGLHLRLRLVAMGYSTAASSKSDSSASEDEDETVDPFLLC